VRLSILTCTLTATAAGAQELNVPPPPTPTAQAPAPSLPQAPTIVARTDLVNMVFSVEGKHGGFVPGLRREDFRVLEDGQPRPIQFFSAENKLPITLGLLLDTSPSQMNVLGMEQQISDNFFRQVITPKDLAFVVGFDVNVSLLQDLTSSKQLLSAAVDQAHIGGGAAIGIGNPGPFPAPSHAGATHLWDAIYLACHDELAHQVGRKAIVVVTDGGEQGSSYTHADALRAALDSNTVVFVIFAYDRGFGGYGGFGPGPGPGQLRRIAEATGGRSFNAGRNIDKAFTELQQELRSQYSLGFRPAPLAGGGEEQPGVFHAVKIELKGDNVPKDAKVHTRSGFYTH